MTEFRELPKREETKVPFTTTLEKTALENLRNIDQFMSDPTIEEMKEEEEKAPITTKTVVIPAGEDIPVEYNGESKPKQGDTNINLNLPGANPTSTAESENTTAKERKKWIYIGLGVIAFVVILLVFMKIKKG